MALLVPITTAPSQPKPNYYFLYMSQGATPLVRKTTFPSGCRYLQSHSHPLGISQRWYFILEKPWEQSGWGISPLLWVGVFHQYRNPLHFLQYLLSRDYGKMIAGVSASFMFLKLGLGTSAHWCSAGITLEQRQKHVLCFS